ncbi:MAG: hypothetical protein ACQKBV_09345, partial [Puniceicoccales bacterium]
MKKTTLLLIATPVLISSAWAGVINTTNYTNDFTSSASDFTTSEPATTSWVLNTGAGQFGYEDTTSGNYLASVQNTAFGGDASSALSFNLSGTVNYPGPDSSGSSDQLGLFFLGDANDPSNAYHFYIRGVNLSGPSVFLAKEESDVISILDSDGDFSHELRDYIGYDLTYDISATYLSGELTITAEFYGFPVNAGLDQHADGLALLGGFYRVAGCRLYAAKRLGQFAHAVIGRLRVVRVHEQSDVEWVFLL